MAAIVVAEMALVGWIVSVVGRRLRERGELRAQLHIKLLERFGNGQELADFLNSEAGRRFLESFSGERPRAGRSILRAVHAGIGLSALALGLLSAYLVLAEEPLAVIAGVAGALGIGFLLAAYASYRLSRPLGIRLSPSDGDARS
jgi:hypothetical protein